MQIVLESCDLNVAFAPPNPASPEGAIVIVASEGGITVPLSIPMLTAVTMAQRILALAQHAAAPQDGVQQQPPIVAGPDGSVFVRDDAVPGAG